MAPGPAVRSGSRGGSRRSPDPPSPAGENPSPSSGSPLSPGQSRTRPDSLPAITSSRTASWPQGSPGGGALWPQSPPRAEALSPRSPGPGDGSLNMDNRLYSVARILQPILSNKISISKLHPDEGCSPAPQAENRKAGVMDQQRRSSVSPSSRTCRAARGGGGMPQRARRGLGSRVRRCAQRHPGRDRRPSERLRRPPAGPRAAPPAHPARRAGSRRRGDRRLRRHRLRRRFGRTADVGAPAQAPAGPGGCGTAARRGRPSSPARVPSHRVHPRADHPGQQPETGDTDAPGILAAKERLAARRPRIRLAARPLRMLPPFRAQANCLRYGGHCRASWPSRMASLTQQLLSSAR